MVGAEKRKSLPPWGDRERWDTNRPICIRHVAESLPQPPLSRTTPLAELNCVTNMCAYFHLFLGFGVVSKSRSLRRRFGLLELTGLSSRLGHILWEFWAALGIRFGKLEKLSLSLSTWDWRGWRSFRGSFSGFVELGLWADWVAWDLDFGFLELRGLIFLAHFLKSLSFLGGWIWKSRKAQTQFI